MNIRSHERRLSPRIRTEGSELRVEGPAGPVRLRPTPTGITAEYAGRELLNGSAARYADEMRAIAVHLALEHEPPWQVDPEVGTRITDHPRFYAETFQAKHLGLETLKRWLGEMNEAV